MLQWLTLLSTVINKWNCVAETSDLEVNDGITEDVWGRGV
jgi:hypothetical protein